MGFWNKKKNKVDNMESNHIELNKGIDKDNNIEDTEDTIEDLVTEIEAKDVDATEAKDISTTEDVTEAEDIATTEDATEAEDIATTEDATEALVTAADTTETTEAIKADIIEVIDKNIETDIETYIKEDVEKDVEINKCKVDIENPEKIGLVHHFANFVVNHNKLIEKIFIVLVILGALASPFVGVNYDLIEYLPDSVASKVAITKMEDTFGYPGTGRIMIKDVTLDEAEKYKQQMEVVDGVDMILWCDTTTDPYQANSFIDYSDIEDYYKDNCAVMDVTFKEGDSSKLTHKAIEQMKQITGDKAYFVGMSPQNKFIKENVEAQMKMILTIGIAFIFVILLVTTTSWFEPVLFLTVILAAVLINKGSNIFLGTISFVTNNVAAVLQIAVSMDYSIFLLHAFAREVEAGHEKKEALKIALTKAINTIMSSSMTTFVGFIVLVTMKFKMGWDLGIVLSKGIVCSLLAVIFLMPALILKWSDYVDKTRHKPFLPKFNKFSKVICKISPVVLGVVLIMTIPAFVAQNMNSFMYGNDAVGAGPGTTIYEQNEEINQKFGRSNLLVALVKDTSMVTEKELVDELEDLDYVKSVSSLAGLLPDGVPETILPRSVTELFHKDGYVRLLISTKTRSESKLAFSTTTEITNIIKKYYPDESYITGNTPATMDMESILSVDYFKSNLLAMLGVFIVVALAFKSILLPIVVMIPIEAAIFVNMAFPYITGDDMIFVGYAVVSCIQLGATVDYAILSTDNYLSCRKTMNPHDSAIEMIRMSFPAILTSGSILIIVGYVINAISSVPAIGEVGHLIGRGAICSMIFVVTLMPVLLKGFDKHITTSFQIRREHRRAAIGAAAIRAKDRLRLLKKKRVVS